MYDYQDICVKYSLCDKEYSILKFNVSKIDNAFMYFGNSHVASKITFAYMLYILE